MPKQLSQTSVEKHCFDIEMRNFIEMCICTHTTSWIFCVFFSSLFCEFHDIWCNCQMTEKGKRRDMENGQSKRKSSICRHVRLSLSITVCFNAHDLNLCCMWDFLQNTVHEIIEHYNQINERLIFICDAEYRN